MSDKYDGACGHELYVNTREEGRVAVTMKVQKVVVGDVSRDEFAFMIAATMFRHIFKGHLSPHDLDTFNLIVEVPEEYLQPEWAEALKMQGAFKFQLSNDPIKNEVSRFIPQVKINGKDETDDSEE